MTTGTSGSRPALNFTLEPHEGCPYLHLTPGFCEMAPGTAGPALD
jgi:hypothetical protein